ncbi:MAG: hypothetical protein K2H96_03550 [Muribaculaceae bacterium]|nr:hypothetical protein [Muribaculaceae bacterium]
MNCYSVEKTTIYIRPIDWTDGDAYGLCLRVSGDNPEVNIDWGDGSVKSFYVNEIEAYHKYTKNENLQFMVEVRVISGETEFIDPCGGECEIEKIDFSGAQSIKEISVENCREIVLDNQNLEKLTVRIYGGSNIDFSKCPDLRHLYFDGGVDMKELNLSECHNLERLEVEGSWQNQEFSKIILSNDAPLKYASLSSVNLSKGSLQFIKSIIDRNNGELRLE